MITYYHTDDQEFTEAYPAGSLYSLLQHTEGDVHRELPSRRTFRFTHQGINYFAKVHSGVGWLEMAKNWVRLRPPVLGAGDEWNALRRLQDAGLSVPAPIALEVHGWNPARQRSVIVMEALENTVTLEDLAKEAISPRDRRRLVIRLADYIRKMHALGVNHRDLYICHFHLEHGDVTRSLHLIDFHRAQCRAHVPYRWRVKDLGSLLFSALDARYTRPDLLCFIRRYSGLSLREALLRDRSMWRGVLRRARWLGEREGAPLPLWLTDV